MKLHVSDNLVLPVDAVTQTFAILGIRGSGKTNTAVVMAEEMLKQSQQTVVLDPTDAWYGVRSSHDGKADGFKVYVFGGEHGDLPLEGTYGKALRSHGGSIQRKCGYGSIHNHRRDAVCQLRSKQTLTLGADSGPVSINRKAHPKVSQTSLSRL